MATKNRWVISLLPAVFCWAAFGDAVPTPETEVSAVRIDAESGPRSVPTVATNGDRFLVAWNDSNAKKILYSVLSSDGSPLAPVPTELGAVTTVTDDRVAVASNGSDFLVVWASAHSMTDYSRRLFAGIVDANGAIRSVRELPMAGVTDPQLAWNGSAFLLLFRTDSGPNQRKGVMLSADGAITAGPVQISSAGGEAAVVAANGSFFAVYETYDSGRPTLYGVLLDGSGRRVSLPLPLAPVSSGPAARIQAFHVSTNGVSFAVAWSEVDIGSAVVYGREIAGNGSSAGAPVVLAGGSTSMYSPSVTWNGTRYILSYSEEIPAAPPIAAQAQLRTLPLNSGLRPSANPSTVDTAARPIGSDLDANASNTIAVWLHVNRIGESTYRTSSSVYTATLDGSGRAGTPILLSRGAAQEESESAASTRGESLIAWEERVGPEQRHSVRAQLASRAGSVPLTIFESPNEQSSPSVAASDSLFLVVWLEKSSGGAQLLGAHVDETGALIEPQPIVISVDASVDTRPSAMWDGRRFAVAWENRAHRIDLAFSPFLSDVVPVSPSRAQYYFDRLPSIAFDGSTYAVVWSADQPSDCPFECANATDVRVTRISREGVVLDSQPLQVFAKASNLAKPSVLWNGNAFVISWGASGVVARRIRANGDFLDPIEGIELTRELGNEHDLLFDGTTYTLAFVPGELWSFGSREKIRLKTFASLTDAASDGYQSIQVAATSVSLTIPPGGPVRLVWTARLDTIPYYGATRIFTSSVAVTASRPLPAPSNLIVTSVGGGALLQWTDNSQDETGFVIEHDDGSISTFSPIAEAPANSSSIFLRNLPLQWHFFKVRAVRGNEESEASNVFSLQTIAQPRGHAVRR